MKRLIVFAAVALSGCLPQAAIQGYEAAAINTLRAAEDHNIILWTANVCGTPLSAMIRHPEIVPAIKALCLPHGGDSIDTLLDAIKR
jgi:hypothetical protein